MKPFNHINATSVSEAVEALGTRKNAVISGGTDLLGTLKDNILPEYPETVVNLKSIPGLEYIKEEDGVLKIGALTRLADIAVNPTVKEKYAALAEAAHAVASPHIREMGTIGGTVSQYPRCWYYRKPENRFNCMRKGGDECFAINGDNRYHSIFGGVKAHASPCTVKCPAGTDIPAYFELIRKGDWDGAARMIMKVNPFPAVTARVCSHFCQEGCNRCQLDEGVLIGGVERALGDYILDHTDAYYAPPSAETGKSVAVVGGGPAGLSAAYYLRRAGNKVTVYDMKGEPGGMLMYAIPAYRLPKDLVRRVIDALRGMGVEFKLGVKLGEDIVPEELERSYDSVCYATGLWKRPVLGISGEELTVFGLDFLVGIKEWMNGKIGSEVFVMGGGAVAMDVALSAKRLGAKKVTVACLETRETMPSPKDEIQRAEEEGVVIYPAWGLSRVVEENGVVKGIELKRCLSTIDATGRFNPQYDENDKMIIKAEHLLMATGQRVDLSYINEKYAVQLNRRGLLDVSADTSMTSRKGIFGAGDASGSALVIGAIASGHKAASGINAYLGTPELTPVPPAPKKLSFDHEGLKLKTRVLKIKELDIDKRRIDIEDSFSPTREEAACEASRCMNCGCYAVNPSDVAPSLIALGAKVVTSKRVVDAEFLFDVNGTCNTVLDSDEIITEIQIPALPAGAKSSFIKFSFRKAIDFPIVNCAVKIGGGKTCICLGAVAPRPYRAIAAEDVIESGIAAGRKLDEALAEEAGEAAVQGAQPFEANKYKVQLAKVMVKRALLAAAK